MSTKSKTFGYGLVGSGSKVLMFTGTEQAFVNGDKTTFTIGSASTATIGTKLDFQVGPSYSFKNFNPSEWGTPTNIEAITKWGEAQGWTTYDFTSVKEVRFNTHKQGSLEYYTNKTFTCGISFQAIAGYRKNGQSKFDDYIKSVGKLGYTYSISDVLDAVNKITQTLNPKALGDNHHAAIPAVLSTVKTANSTWKDLQDAIKKDTDLDSAIHPESVMQVTKDLVFLGVSPESSSTNPPPVGTSLLLGKSAILATRDATDSAPFEKNGDAQYVNLKQAPIDSVEVARKKVTATSTAIELNAKSETNQPENASVLIQAAGSDSNINILAPTIAVNAGSDNSNNLHGLSIAISGDAEIKLAHKSGNGAKYISITQSQISVQFQSGTSITMSGSEIKITQSSSTVTVTGSQTTISSGGVQVQLSGGQVKVGSGLKVIG
ncbi:MAG: hypothetical protein ACOYMH_02255 [Zwartia sp.]